jgi:tRNA dimethylallyltransferase
VAETRTLVERGFERFLTSTQAIGYAEAVAFLHGSADEARLVSETVRRTKALARRQLAWLRRDPRIRWFPAGEAGAAEVVEPLIEYLAADAVARRHPMSPIRQAASVTATATGGAA